jgi:hypothetical protein
VLRRFKKHEDIPQTSFRNITMLAEDKSTSHSDKAAYGLRKPLKPNGLVLTLPTPFPTMPLNFCMIIIHPNGLVVSNVMSSVEADYPLAVSNGKLGLYLHNNDENTPFYENFSVRKA